MVPDSSFLVELIQTKMPYGKYEGRYIHQIPVHYLEWMQKQGWPNGKLGQFLATMYEIKINGIEQILEPIKNMVRQQACKRQVDW